ncbi:hypothetical protein F2Q69_00028414 [Brassica cretica]|uniref:Uncharacterized protein n=1 Tax=Brassica cretica TaxID=69181 RepID=A0A8S9S8Y4_BRACR|nr:hypothetical protein F2Q69_00028414 [Brassica cretica]
MVDGDSHRCEKFRSFGVVVAISRGEVITKRRSFDSDLNYWVTLLYIPTVLRTVGEFRVRIFPMAMEVSAPLFYPLTGSKSVKPVRSDFLKFCGDRPKTSASSFVVCFFVLFSSF